MSLETWAGRCVVESHRVALVIDEYESVVYGAGVTGPKFHASNEASRAGRHGQDEVAIDIAAVGGQGKGLGHGDDRIGRAELPAVGERRDGRREGGISLGCALVMPALKEGDFSGCQPALADKRAMAGDR